MELGIEEVRQDENDRPASQSVPHVGERQRDVRALALGFVRQDFADDAENVRTALARADVAFGAFGEKQQAALCEDSTWDFSTTG